MNCRTASLTGKIWDVQSEEKSANFVEILARNRGIDDLHAFVNVSVKNSMPDPFVFVDMKKAACRIVDAIKNKQKIAILGDYDVDGISSTVIFIKFLTHIGCDCTYSIPSRTEEGYGLSISNIEKHKECLIIAVDCGSVSAKELDYASDNCIDVIVIDHHKMSIIPHKSIIVNPHRPDEKGDYRYLCATGLVFICLVGIDRMLKEIGFYFEIQEPNLTDYLDLVAMATVCDVVDLIGLNRAFVSEGIKTIKMRKNLGIDALLSIYRNAHINSETVSFFLGPRLNAAGRIASADISVRLLTTQNASEAKEIALHLNELNIERQALEQKIMEEAISSIEEDKNFICLYKPSWHVGIIGIIAGRLKEKYNKLSIIISRDSNGKGKASCRSVDTVDISNVIKKGIEKCIIISGGGHSMAAGFLIDVSKIDDLIEFLKSEIKHSDIQHKLYADCVIPLDLISIKVMKSISVLEPFGMKNRYPKFVIPNVKLFSIKVVGENHISFSLCDKKGNSIRGISFRSLGTQLGDVLTTKSGFISVLGALTISSKNSVDYVNFQLDDISSHLFN